MVGIYVRQSVDKKESISIETQIDECKKELLPNEQYKIFSDKGFSGKNTKRPAFTSLMNEVENGSINKVITYKLDRISRALLDFGKIMEKFKKYNVEFISRNEKFDTTTPVGEAMLNIIMVFAQLERQTIQMRIKDNYYSRGEKGFYLGGTAPFGFVKAETKLAGKKTYCYAPHSVNSEIVISLFYKYAETDISLGKMAQELTEKGIRTSRGNCFSSAVLGRILRNPSYVKADAEIYSYFESKGAIINNSADEFVGENGCYLYGENGNSSNLTGSYLTIALHKGIVSSEIWLACQKKLNTNKQIGNLGKGTHSWLSGLLKCENCSMGMSIVSDYLYCNGRKQHICKAKTLLRSSEVESLTELLLLKQLEQLNWKKVIVRPAFTAEKNKLNGQIIVINNEIKSLVENLKIVSGRETVHCIETELEQLAKQRNSLQAELFELNKNQTEENNSTVDYAERFKTEWKSFLLSEKKTIAKILIEKVVVSEDKISVYFN